MAKVERESETVSSFYLRRADGEPISVWAPGQFLPIRVAIPERGEPVLRTYTLSTRSNPEFYRLSIRRGEGASLVSRFMHSNAKAGFRLHAMMPRGKFLLDENSSRPVVLVSGGVGITPMIAITEHIVEQGERTGAYRPIHFIHGTQNSAVQAFGKHIRELASRHPALSVHVCYSQPLPKDKVGVTHESDGRIDIGLLTRLLPLGDYDFYLCGPSQFMNALYSGLTGIGIRPERIHYESFGPGTVLKPEFPGKPVPVSAVEARGSSAARVKFARSEIEAVWFREDGTLLEFAEEVGLAPAFGCRSGICGTCKTKLIHGGVDYLEEPLAERGEGNILLCCSVPRRSMGYQNGDGPDVILDL